MDRAIYGKKGIDIECRLGLYRAMGQKGFSEAELKDAMLPALPLKLGEPFSTAAALLTLIGGFLFIALAPEKFEMLDCRFIEPRTGCWTMHCWLCNGWPFTSAYRYSHWF